MNPCKGTYTQVTESWQDELHTEQRECPMRTTCVHFQRGLLGNDERSEYYDTKTNTCNEYIYYTEFNIE